MYIYEYIVFEQDFLNTENDETNDVVSFEQGVWCTKSWSRAPVGTANFPAGNRIFCCQPGTHLRCSCPNDSDAAKEATATSSTTGCCPTTDYSVKRVDKEWINDAWRYNFRRHSNWLATPNDCESCLPGPYTDELNLQRWRKH